MERGYEATTQADIARRVGISSPSLYWHYKSKQDVLYAFLERQWIDFTARMKEAAGQGTATQRLRSLATSHVRYEIERLMEARAFSQQFSKSQLHRTLPPERRKVLQGYLDRYLLMCCSIIEEGVADGSFEVSNPRAVGFAIINMCETVAGWFDPTRFLTAEEMASLYGDLALRLVGVMTDHSSGEDDSGSPTIFTNHKRQIVFRRTGERERPAQRTARREK